MPNQDLKQCLFEHAKKYHERYVTFKSVLGADNEMTIKCENKYLGCYFVICDSELLEEYQQWLKREEMKDNV